MNDSQLTLPPRRDPLLPPNVVDVRSRMARLRVRVPREPRPGRRPRVLLYSHDTMGLGHLRRNLLIAKVMSEAPLEADVLMVTGAREAGRFQLPPGVECMVLPAYAKGLDGGYRARRLRLELPELVRLRSRSVLAAVEGFDPDLMVVDNVARGVGGELDDALYYLRASGARTVLGLRDVRDEASVVREEWARQGFEDAVRDLYDEIWVYGDAGVCDPRSEYGMAPDVAAKVRVTGYLDQTARLAGGAGASADSRCPEAPEGRYGLCMVGGGQDGAELAEAFAQAALPEGVQGLLVTGPYMDPEVRGRLMEQAARRPGLWVKEFISEPVRLLQHAEFAVGMGGYNSVSEMLSCDVPGLVVPRVRPRREQLIRAERLQAMGLLDMLHPDRLTPEALSGWLAETCGGARPQPPRTHLDISGLSRLPVLAADVLGATWHPEPARAAESA